MLHRVSFSPRPTTTARSTLGFALAVASIAAACSDSTAPDDRPDFEPAASVRWNAIARDLIIKYNIDPPLASRTYALLSVAQDRAVRETVRLGASNPKPLDHAAAVSASLEILTAAFAAESAVLDSIARGDLADPLWSADAANSVSDGESIGRAAARALLAERANDGAAASWTGPLPSGPGMWYSSATPTALPLRPLWGSVKPWLMTRGDQFRPEPPPTFGSAAFQAALAEVRRYSDQRTQRELDIAKHWGDGAGTYTPPGHWNRIASDLATWYNLSEAEAACLRRSTWR
jgi:hypothetical protein